MATSPVKRQQQNHPQSHREHNPLHNFSFLKWGNKSHANSHHRSRRVTDSPPFEHERLQAPRRSPTTMYGVESREVFYDMQRFAEEDQRNGVDRRSQSGRFRFGFESVSAEEKEIEMENRDEEMDEEAAEDEEEEMRDKLKEESQKLWNLRPRKTAAARSGGHQIGVSGGRGSVGASSKNNDVHVNNGWPHEIVTTAQPSDVNAPKSLRLRGMADAHGGVEKKKEKAKLWISLSKEEIEEDIFILTGSRPVRRPKRRPKSVQKQLDLVFPGLTLLGATADSFKIPDSPPKK